MNLEIPEELIWFIFWLFFLFNYDENIHNKVLRRRLWVEHAFIEFQHVFMALQA